jgi:ribosomal protein L11 methyltransferase
MYLWRRLAAPQWLLENEETLRSRAGDQLAITERPNRKRLQLEVACDTEKGRKLLAEFGGRIEQLPRNWLKRFSRNRQSKPLKIGKRLVIINVGGTSASRGSRHKGPSHILIPAGAAFGTGEHVTTALSLRLLEQITRTMNPGWWFVDLGTGSGILALAAKCFGADRVLAMDNDSRAIVTAKENMRLNKIGNVDFRVADVRKWRPGAKIDIIIANLFSELLIEILPKLRRCLKLDGWLVLSGVLREQEAELMDALRRNKIATAQIRRRGKWVTVLAQL